MQWFAGVDTDRSGHIDALELQRALMQGNLNFSLATVAHMIRMHDTDRTGNISFDQFCAVHQFLGTAQASFMQFDRDRSGQLTLDEISMALNAQGFRLETTAFYALCAAFDPDRSASIGMAEYIAMSIFLQSCSRTFKAFDPQGTGQISLDYNQFVFAAAATK